MNCNMQYVFFIFLESDNIASMMAIHRLYNFEQVLFFFTCWCIFHAFSNTLSLILNKEK